MGTALTILAPAKINLFLDVLGIRDDGYHDISSIMQSVSLFDEVTVKLSPSHAENYVISLNCSGTPRRSDTLLPCDEKNLAYKAASAYLDYIGADSVKANIFIEKNIPVSAGLAGGSADAAAVLILLNRLSGDILNVETLCKIGRKIGADVPFCIHSGIYGGAMKAEGIGDILTEHESLASDVFIVICAFDIEISTPWAYREIDRLRENGYIYKSDTADRLYNSFEDAVIPYHPIIGEVKQKLIDSGAYGALMSGSGASVFGLFSDENTALSAAELIQNQVSDVRTFVCNPYVTG